MVLIYLKFERGMTFQSVRTKIMKYDRSKNIYYLPFNTPRYEKFRLGFRGEYAYITRKERFEDPE